MSAMAEIPTSPLLPSDPPHIGDFWLDARLHARASGVCYIAHDQANQRVRLTLLSAGAAQDKAARDRFSGLVNAMHIDNVIARGGQDQDEGRLGRRFREPTEAPTAADDGELAPWVAMPWTRAEREVAEVENLLAEVELANLTQPEAEGPDYEHYWLRNAQPGRTRVWPLPWPGRYTRSGWVSLLISWLLMMVLAALALLIAYLLFRQSDPVPEPQPVPSSASSGSGSPQSGSPQPESASPTPEPSGESPEPSDSASGQASPSPPPRL